MPTVPQSVPARSEWNLLELERLVEKHVAPNDPEADELECYLLYLRDHAAVDGTLPDHFDQLVWEVFGELAELDRAAAR